MYVKGQSSRASKPAPATDVAIEIVRNNAENLARWDFRFYYLKRLLKLAEAVPLADACDMKPFFEANLQELEQRPSSASVRNNVRAGTFLTLVSSLAVWFFKNFQNQILAYVRQLVK